MKILVVHNDYGRYSGEEAVVDRQIADYRSAGFEVLALRLSSEGSRDKAIGKVHGFFAGIFSFRGRHLMRECLADFQPDIIHIHNLYPFISPAVLPLCKRTGVPVVMTVHNYRLICPTGLFLRNGKPCELCLEHGNEWSCIRHNCEKSILRSIGYALRGTVSRKTRAYLDNVDYFCCLTEFQRQKLISAGFEGAKVRVFPNCVEHDDMPDAIDSQQNGGYVGYVGRLSYEKGFDMLVEVARRHPEIEFRFAGTPREGVEDPGLSNVRLCGQLDQSSLSHFYADSLFITIPSRCYEGFPVVLLEASSRSRCCVVPRHGAFPDLITDDESGEVAGLLFNPLDVDSLERMVVSLWNNPAKAELLGAQAKKNYLKRFRKDTVTSRWIDFVRSLITPVNNITHEEKTCSH